jgi:hypothetical protein
MGFLMTSNEICVNLFLRGVGVADLGPPKEADSADEVLDIPPLLIYEF